MNLMQKKLKCLSVQWGKTNGYRNNLTYFNGVTYCIVGYRYAARASICITGCTGASDEI